MALSLENLKPIFPKYDYKRTDKPKEACATYLSSRNPFNLPPAGVIHLKGGPRSSGGKLTTQDIDWKGRCRGLFFHHPPGDSDVICVRVSEDCKVPVPVICRGRTRTRCTQTCYRESSAQTRPYLPEIAGDKENYQHFEIYQISKLLHNNFPPGEYEAKVVQRYRRRRKYEKALKLTVNDKEKHNAILEALEWENWVAREEDIQGCQMLRMELVQRMFKEREAKLNDNSQQRITCSAERIQAKRAAQLKKINVEFARGMRRLEAKKQNIIRSYHKANITQEHVDPASDLHAPQMRFGVNPNRRHFVGFRKKFDDRIDELDKQKDERGLASLKCPFSKLRNWAKPKERMKEVSQRFCSDENLKNLYESLKGLRSQAEAPKPIPRCLKKKDKTQGAMSVFDHRKTTQRHDSEKMKAESELVKIELEEEDEITIEELTENLRQRRAKEWATKNVTEISNVVGEYEGTTLGNQLRQLNDELERLKQQKKFQAILMLAERERWRREACEAGLRQKENKLREDQEELFKAAYEVHRDTASLFLEAVLEEEFKFTTENLATEKITEMAKEIDSSDWDSMRLQGRERRIYDHAVISDYVRSQVFPVAEKRLAKKKADMLNEALYKVMEDELNAKVKKGLDEGHKTPDSVTVVGELLDGLLENAVIYDFDIISQEDIDEKFYPKKEINEIINKLIKMAIRSPFSRYENFVDSSDYETRLIAQMEARAIINKLVKIAVPEERWKHESDRIVEETLSETFNSAIFEVECLKASRIVKNDDKLHEIISDVYRRIGYSLKKNRKSALESSGDSESGELKSARSTIDIFDRPLGMTPSESADDFPVIITEENGPRFSMRKIDYIDTDTLEKFEPVEIGRRHERFNIMGKVARRFQHDEPGGDNVVIFGEDSDLSDVSAQPSQMGKISYTSQYVELVTSRAISSPWLRTIHPELVVCSQRGNSHMRLTSSYQRTSEHIIRTQPTCPRKKRKERRATI